MSPGYEQELGLVFGAIAGALALACSAARAALRQAAAPDSTLSGAGSAGLPTAASILRARSVCVLAAARTRAVVTAGVTTTCNGLEGGLPRTVACRETLRATAWKKQAAKRDECYGGDSDE